MYPFIFGIQRAFEKRGLIGFATVYFSSAVRSTTAKMPSVNKIRRMESSSTLEAAMIRMVWTAITCDEYGQQLAAGVRPVPRRYYDIKGRPDQHVWMEAFVWRLRSSLILAHFLF